MFFSDVIGQETAKRELLASSRAGIIPHAQLFVGADGMGGLGLAYAYARYINCLQPLAEDACGHCPSCLRFNQFAGQDLIFLFPIVNVGSRNLCEDDLPLWRRFLSEGAHTRYSDWLSLLGGDSKRPMIFAREGDQLLSRLSYQVADARYRVIIIWLPERMHEVLSNKLLKLIEEPPQHTVILMVTEAEDQVLGTLRSRMQTTYLRPVEEQTITQALMAAGNNLSGTDANEAAHLSGGNYRLALEYIQGSNPEYSMQLDFLKRILRATVDALPHRMRQLADELSKLTREEQLRLLEYLATTFREIFALRFGIAEISYLRKDEEPLARYIQTCINGENLAIIHEEINLAQRHISQNVNSRIVFFDFILKLTSILAKVYKAHGIR